MEALIVVDVQYDFLPGGALAVPEGHLIIDTINHLMPRFQLVVATQDWHPRDHGSFASNNPGKRPGEIVTLAELDQILWVDHCIQGTWGAQFHRDLNSALFSRVFQKGTESTIDSYSGFFDNGHLKPTGLGDYLDAKGVKEVSVVGLATDYCVKFTALDAVDLGFRTTVISDATRAVNLDPGDYVRALEELKEAGVWARQSRDLGK